MLVSPHPPPQLLLNMEIQEATQYHNQYYPQVIVKVCVQACIESMQGAWSRWKAHCLWQLFWGFIKTRNTE